MKNILLVSTCNERLHNLEFVKPLKDILEKAGVKSVVKNYMLLKNIDLENAAKVIICGTSLKDNRFLQAVEKFYWLKDFEKPVLGICAGMQILGLVFGGNSKSKTEIGFYFENFENIFLGLNGKKEVYHLHNSFVSFGEEFEIFSKSKEIVQAVKHKEKPFYGVLFHPEVRQKKMILEFVNAI
jgi:GMP synthase-like glutamine amidotransferase